MDSYVIRLQRLDSCAVSDAMDKLGLEGYISGLRQVSSERKIAGKAITYKLVAAGEAVPDGAGQRHLGTTAVELASSENVIVVEQNTGIDAACWGGMLSLAAKKRNVAGVVASGPVRDVDEAISLEFPIYSPAGISRTARGRLIEQATNCPVSFGGVVIAPGDYLIADGSGVMRIRQQDIEQVLTVAETIHRKEAAMAKAVLSGMPVSQVMNGSYENMLARQASQAKEGTTTWKIST